MVTRLTNYELQLVTDAEVLLTKNKIIQKVYEIFGGLAEVYKKEFETQLYIGENLIDAKISRGENYLGLPYVMLDYPRQFSRNDIFSIRTFFWWGNFFSITLQLSGRYQYLFNDSLQKALSEEFFTEWFLGISEDPWQHHFKEENYKQLERGETVNINSLPFLKVAKKIPLAQWDSSEIFFVENFKLIINALKGKG